MAHLAVTANELIDLHRRGDPVNLIDVRTPAEFREVHATLARNVPLESLKPQELDREVSGPLYVICRSGNRANLACDRLKAAGYEDLVVIDGGMLAWKEAGLPVKRGKKTVSLERQVRIAAGSLVLVGSALGYFVNPYFIGLSAFVGAGLLFAGVTDTCGMGMLLARMPWNQASAGSAQASGQLKATHNHADKECKSC